MSRVFWMAVGAVGGVVAYRKGTRALEQARELGPLGTARAAASATSRLAGRTAHGLGRLEQVRDRRAGRLLVGAVEADEQLVAGGSTAGVPAVGPVPATWVPAGQVLGTEQGATARSRAAGSGAATAPSVVILAEGDTGEPDDPAPARPHAARTPGPAGSATPRTTRPRRG